ncbi:DUF192 domain-containing protein [Candidatus Roizmanbacteria bacterium]|nr:DUF192 domain-containing protein [Candidatus Roizmanbacteria bacterium]
MKKYILSGINDIQYISMYKKVIFLLLICFLLYTRLVGLDWGLPYPMHPDERNMVNAIQQLNCENSNFKFPYVPQGKQISNCLNPHFFAYGQFPLYLAYFGIQANHFLANVNAPIGFDEATMALRIISAVASVLNVFVLLRLLEFLIRNSKFENNLKLIKNFKFQISNLLILAFSPYFIQFSHFGTTESLLMLFYSIIIYLSFKLIDLSSRVKRSGIEGSLHFGRDDNAYLFLLALVSGLSIATKVSSVIFLAVPLTVISYVFFLRVGSPPSHSGGGFPLRQKKYIAAIFSVDFLINILKFVICIFVVFAIFSPHNIISFPDFISSINYESSVALGSYVAFYTRQFVETTPLLFQFTKIFPYALGWPQYILAILGFFLLSWKNKYINLLRFALLVYFIPTSFMFAKWSRFMAPIFPIMSVFAVLFLFKIFSRSITVIKIIIIIIFIIPGLAYLSIYQNPDVRFEASEWIYQNIPPGSKILSETANVVDVPIQPPPSTFKIPSSTINRLSSSYKYASFNFYDLDENPTLPVQLDQLIEAADYIFIPSRRIFANHPKENYPLLNSYYNRLFSGPLGFEKVAEFSSYPRLVFQISNFKFQIPFPDESAEETWTVFDHPVIRIYKKIPNSKSQDPNKSQISNLKNYQTISYQLKAISYKLLLADTPEKWEQGLMYVRNKKDIGGLDGMLFQFPDKKMRTFWNKNTVSNLDLYWIDGDKIVGTSKLPAIGESGEITTMSSPLGIDKVVELLP